MIDHVPVVPAGTWNATVYDVAALSFTQNGWKSNV